VNEDHKMQLLQVSQVKHSLKLNYSRPIYVVVLATAVEGSSEVKRAQCNWTKTRTLQLCVYMRFTTTGFGVLAADLRLAVLASRANKFFWSLWRVN